MTQLQFEIEAYISVIAVAGIAALLILLVLLVRSRGREARLADASRTSLADYEARFEELRALSESRQHALEIENTRLASGLEQSQEQLVASQELVVELTKTKDAYIQLQARSAEKDAQLASKAALLDEAKSAMLKEFELTAGKLFESKQQSFSQASRQNLESVLNPFRDQLRDFHKRVEDVHSTESSQRGQLIGQIAELQKQAQKISADANNLASALKGDNKVQGNWGELVLERLLEQSGLTKGREYDTQTSYKNDDGRRLRPDVVVHLPDQKDIVIDAKVSLVDYERFAMERVDSVGDTALKAHVDSIRSHIKGLSLKQYEHLEGINTVDFVFMFVPIEAAYVAAIQSAPTLFREAHDKNIMLVSPSSLMVALRTVEAMWRYEKQNANAEKIAASAGKLYDQFVLVMEAFEEVGGYLQKAETSYDKAFSRLGRGRGNVLKRVSDLKKLGAKASKSFPSASAKILVEEGPEPLALLADEEDKS